MDSSQPSLPDLNFLADDLERAGFLVRRGASFFASNGIALLASCVVMTACTRTCPCSCPSEPTWPIETPVGVPVRQRLGEGGGE
jgi:hypothetical protein